MAELTADGVPELYARITAGDLPFELFTDDVELRQTSSLLGTAGTYRGHAGLTAVFAELAEDFADMQWLPGRVDQTGNRLVVELRLKARGRSSGIPLDATLAHVLELRDGKIARAEAFDRRRDAYAAAGIERQSRTK